MPLAARQHGVSLLELVIAMGLLTAFTGALFALIHPSRRAFSAAPDTADLQQRLRVAVDALTTDLMMAGAGPFEGSSVGPLVQQFAPLRPGPTGTLSDAVTLMYVPTTAVQTTTAAEFTPASEQLQLAADPGCPVGALQCGTKAGMKLLVFDPSGNADLLNVVGVTATYALVTNASRPAESPRPSYLAGSTVAEAVMRRYWRKSNAPPASDQLMRDDAPVVDHVTGLTFDYYAEAAPGERLAKLAPAQLADGPWVPDGADPGRWDVDWRRIRKIGVTIRVEAPAGKGAAPVPDQEVRWQISPRNLEWSAGPP